MRVSGTSQCTFDVHSGMSQGSCIGPTGYLIYGNDIIDYITQEVFISVFADDIKMLKSIHTEQDTLELQSAINRLQEWASDNKLTINASKTQFITYGARNFNTKYYVSGQEISRVDNIRDLGVIFDQKVNFKAHLRNIIVKAKRMIAIGKRLCHEVGDHRLLLKIYNIYVRPILEYCCQVWTNDTKTQIDGKEGVDKILKDVTAYVLRLPVRRRPGMPGYIDYPTRCHRLRTPMGIQRRKYLGALQIAKMKMDVNASNLHEELDKCTDVPMRFGIQNVAFSNQHYVFPKKSPLIFMAKHFNESGIKFSDYNLINEMKNALKRYFLVDTDVDHDIFN